MKCLVVGDCHFDNQYQGYLKSQLDTLDRLVSERKPHVIVFLGDLFHHRKPDPTVIVAVFEFFKKISLKSPVREIYVLRGNHDSANKSDDGLTVLSTLTYPGSRVRVILQSEFIPHLNFFFIPHYENEEKILEGLNAASIEHLRFTSMCNDPSIVFGHFGFTGCLNSTGYQDFGLPIERFKNRTILGHIHQYKKEQNITILGTPWSTNFGELDYPHYVGEMSLSYDSKWSELELIEVTHGPRHYKVPFESLETMGAEISSESYFTILRVILDRFSDETTNDLRSKILKDYKVAYVDLKFQPIFDKKLNNRLSDFDPQQSLDIIDNNIIDKYLDEQKSTIPTEELRKGLEIINTYADTVN